MRILQIGTYYLPHFGGIEKVEYDLSKILRKYGHETKLICFNDSPETVIDEYEGQQIIRVGIKRVIASQAISFEYFSILKKIIKEFNPDVIHIHFPNPLIAFYLKLINPKCKITIHWHSDVIKQKVLKKFYTPLEQKMLKRADRIIATSQLYVDNSKSLEKFKNKVQIVPCIVDSDFLDKRDLTAEKEIKSKYPNKKIIFFIGVHRLYKGIIHLVEAAEYLPDEYIVLIAGSGPLTTELKEYVANKHLTNVEFLGRISEEEKRNYLYVAETFAFPSITKNEAFGIALAEALYCGTPAVTFYIEGSGVNYVNQKNISGIEVDKQDSKLYANALIDCKKSIYGNQSEEWCKNNFTEQKIEEKVLNFFNF